MGTRYGGNKGKRSKTESPAKKKRHGQRLYDVGLELERNEAERRTNESVDGRFYGVEVGTRAR